MPERIRRVQAARVLIWGREVGAVAWNAERQLGSFEFAPSFLRGGPDLAPLTMPLRPGIFSFPALSRDTFRGLPGLLADSLPDRFGNALIGLWLRQRGRDPEDFSPVERLCYIGSRGMGALEFAPPLVRDPKQPVPLEVAELALLAKEILARRAELSVKLRGARAEALATIIRVGTSAGGARAKAVVAWNRATDELRSGQTGSSPGFEPWILKFDGVRDQALGDPEGYGRIEMAYHRMAVAAGIVMTECRLLEEGSRAHFMTRRFDRDADGNRIHMQSLCALGHYDFNMAGAYGYEHALAAIQRLNLGHESLRQMYRRMVFNVIARNQDDHTRNIAFLMDPQGRWSLAPAFDVIWAFNEEGRWTSRHQMSVNGKQDGFERKDLLAVAGVFGVRNPGEVIEEVGTAVTRWPALAREAGVSAPMIRRIAGTHRLGLAGAGTPPTAAGIAR